MDIENQDLQIDRKELIKFAATLIRYKSVCSEDDKDEKEMVEFIVRKMKSWGWSPDVDLLPNGKRNIIVTITGGMETERILGFEGHLDVVTAGDPQSWDVDPFGGIIKNGRLYGRGAADMKSGIAAMLFGVRAFEKMGSRFGGIRLLLLSDEEGMMSGAKYAVDQGHLNGVSGVIICESEGGEVCPSSKGAIRVRVEVTGKMAHGAMPEEGKNPITVLTRIVQFIEDYEEKIQQIHGQHRYLGKIFLTPTVISAGDPVQMNCIPEKASLWIDIRTIPSVNEKMMLKEIRSGIAEISATYKVDSVLEVVDSRCSVETAEDDPLVRAVLAGHKDISGCDAKIGGVPGATDGTIFTREVKTPTVVYGPGGKTIAHKVNEYVELKEIYLYACSYARGAWHFFRN